MTGVQGEGLRGGTAEKMLGRPRAAGALPIRLEQRGSCGGIGQPDGGGAGIYG